MAVVSVNEVTNEQEGRDETSDDTQRSYARKFYVVCDSVYDDAGSLSSAINAGGLLPVKYQPYTNNAATYIDNEALALGFEYMRVENHPFLWVATIRYSTKIPKALAPQYADIKERGGPKPPTGGGGSGGQPPPTENKIEWPTRISGATREIEIPAVWAYDRFSDDEGLHVAITNSAGALFDPPVKKKKIVLDLTLTRYRARPLDYGYIQDKFANHMSSAAFMGFKKWDVYLASYNFEFEPEHGQLCWKEVFRFNVDTDPVESEWWPRVLDQGLCESDAKGNLVPIMSSNGQQVTEPVLLDGRGKRLDKVKNPDAKPHWFYPRLAPFADFNALNFKFVPNDDKSGGGG